MVNNLIELKTAELVGAALDWAVGRAAGVDFGPDAIQSPREVIIGGYQGRPRVHWAPSHYWAQLGPLIKKYQLDLTFERVGLVYAYPCKDDGLPVIETRDHYGSSGPTHEIAACRAIVASHFGETVGIPNYLLEA